MDNWVSKYLLNFCQYKTAPNDLARSQLSSDVHFPSFLSKQTKTFLDNFLLIFFLDKLFPFINKNN